MQLPDPSRKAWLRVAAHSTEGPVRPHNEDAVAVFALGGGGARGDGKLTPAALPGAWPADAGVALVVLDGMGGQSTGDVPCAYAIEALAGRLCEAMPAGPAARGARNAWLVDAICLASEHIERRANPDAGQAATVVLAVAVGAELHLVHAGDVRAYLLRDGRLAQLTRDDSLLNTLRDQGVPEEDLREAPDNVLTQVLGHPRISVQPHGQVLEVGRGDVLLICTNGLHTAVDPATIEEALRRPLDLQEACRVLVELAEAAGAQHNITVMLARVEVR